MSLESIDKLRDCTFIGSGKVNEYLDEIEREIAERYMERPCDKNGEPTCVGQRIRHRGHEGEVWLLGVHEVMCSDRVCYPCGEYEHVKPRTLEDVLFDCYAAIDYDKKAEDGHRKNELLRKYAAEIRDLMVVDR